MSSMRVTGWVREDGHVEFELPMQHPVGAIELVVEIVEDSLTEEELLELTKLEPMTGAEIIAAGLTGAWEDRGIEDSVEWVEQQRQARREKRL